MQFGTEQVEVVSGQANRLTRELQIVAFTDLVQLLNINRSV